MAVPKELFIQTMGNFDISTNGRSLLRKSVRSNRVWNLFKFLLSYRNMKMPPLAIAEGLWENRNYEDPQNVLRTQIFRLRQTLKANEITNNTYMDCFHIVFSNGCYAMQVNEGCVIDTDLFEQLLQQATTAQEAGDPEAKALYTKALALYKGEYLVECPEFEWLVQLRSQYHRQYTKGVLALLALLAQEKEHAVIVELCETAFAYEPFSEEINLYYLQALLDLGRTKNAAIHYQYIISYRFQELGEKPSEALRALHMRIQQATEGKLGDIDLSNISVRMGEGSDEDGPLLCDLDTFRFLYRLEKRRSARNGQLQLVALINFSSAQPSDCVAARVAMEDQLMHTLRKGDVFTAWNDAQLVLMLADVPQNKSEQFAQRVASWATDIKKRFHVECDVMLHPVLSMELS